MKQEEINRYNSLSGSLKDLAKHRKGAVPEPKKDTKPATMKFFKENILRSGKDGANGRDGKDAPELQPLEIADKLNTLTGVLDAKVIGNFPAQVTADDVISELKSKKGNDRLDISNIRNGEQLAAAAQKISMNDMRWHGAGLSTVSHDDTLTGNGTPSSPLSVVGGGGSGTVTSVSVANANGFNGSVANATTTPAITLSTTVTGVLKGNGTAISAAVSNTDYQAPITLTTTGSSGASTFDGTTLNIPQYSGGGGGGDVTGPASSTDNAIARFDGTTGKIIQNSAVTIADTSGNITGGTYNGNTIGSGSTSGTNTGDQTITLTGDVTGSGTGSFATAIGTGVIVNADVNASAAVDLTKLAATTASRALVSDGSGFITPATTTATEIGYVNGVTSSIQTQLNAKGAGTVTSVSVTTANGVSGSVATATTTPAITLTLGAITPTSVNGTTSTELGYVSGVTSAIQTQLNGKQATGNYITALTGDVTASGPGSAASTLATVNSNVGSFTNASITVNGKGLITAASSGTAVTPGGSTTQLQYNNAGAFGGISGATTNGTNTTFGSGNLLATLPQITTGITDANANRIVGFTPTASANTYVNITNGNSAAPVIGVAGTSTNLAMASGGSGTLSLAGGNGYFIISGDATSSASEALTLNIPGGGPATIGTAGSNIPIVFNPNGTGTLKFSKNATPTANDGAALGTTALSWSDLFLASGGVINFNNGNATLTHSTGLITSNVPFSVGTSNAVTAGTIELGAATDTTLSRVAAGVMAVEGETLNGYETTATAAGTTTLTIASAKVQYFTGSSTQTVKLPTTSVVLGQPYTIVNNSTGLVTVQSSGSNTIQILGAGMYATFTALAATPTTAANWNCALSTFKGLNNAITATSNAATIDLAYVTNTVTNNSAATLTVTFPTAGAIDGEMRIVRIYDFSAAAQTLTLVNTENSTVTPNATTNGSTTLPYTIGGQYNAATSKWRIIAAS